MYNKWGGGGSVQLDDQSDLDDTRSNVDVDRASVKSLEETQQSWLLGAGAEPKKKGIDLGCVILSRRMCCLLLCFFVFCGFVAGLTVLIIYTVPHKHHKRPPADNYTQALHLALKFFDAQYSGKLPPKFSIPWRGDSGLRDGLDDPQGGGPKKDLTGGFYDAGDNIKFTFPGAYAMTILSWSVIEYKQKYIALGEYDHTRNLIKWGTDFLFKTFNYTVNTTDIPYIFAQVGSGSRPTATFNDHYCWERPETIDYPRTSYAVNTGSELAGEMAATMAAASIVFKDNPAYSKKCLTASKSLLNFAESKSKRGRYTAQIGDLDSVKYYNSSSYWDEYVWANAWLYFASGNVSYLARATLPELASNANAGGVGSHYYGLLSWDNKLLGAQVLLTRLRIMKSPAYPYEDQLFQYHNQTSLVMCSYLPQYKQWNQTKGGLTLFNYGNSGPLQYAATAAFVASLFADYLTTTDILVWQCGPNFFPAEKLRNFARSQIDYILWKNPARRSYVVGYGKNYPKQVHHRAASIPHDKVKYSCTGGFQFRDANKPNVHVINGAMVAGPDKRDVYVDRCNNYTYTEPTVAGNAGLVGALISLSKVLPGEVDSQTLFANLPSMYIAPPPPPSPWKPAP